MSISKFYKYIFYKIYRLAESMAAPWWSDVKATSLMTILLLFIVSIGVNVYKLFINKFFNIFEYQAEGWGILTILIVFNHYIFMYRDKWKDIIKEFDKLPKKKNRIGSWVVLLFISLIIISLFYSFYLAGQIDWSQYQ